MAVGDVKSALQAVASGQNLDIRPPAGEEWVIHNLYYTVPSGYIYFRITDGTNVIQIDQDNSNGARLGVVFHVTNSLFLRLNNATGASNFMGYDGIQTK